MRVLLVEDDRRIASDISRALEAAGYVVETVGEGEEAWFRGDTEDYGAVILDLGLPGMDGLAVLKRWRANGRHMPVLILTARASWAERVDGIDAGADDYLPKPFRIEELLARLRSIVRRSAGHASSVVSAGDITLDERQMRVSVRGVPVTATKQCQKLGITARAVGPIIESSIGTRRQPMTCSPCSPARSSTAPRALFGLGRLTRKEGEPDAVRTDRRAT